MPASRHNVGTLLRPICRNRHMLIEVTAIAVMKCGLPHSSQSHKGGMKNGITKRAPSQAPVAAITRSPPMQRASATDERKYSRAKMSQATTGSHRSLKKLPNRSAGIHDVTVGI